VVTGAGAGMGEATAMAYAKRGARVLAADIDADAAGRVVKTIQGAGGTAVLHEVDLRHKDEVYGMIDAAVDQFDGIDILANVAGIYPSTPVEEMTEEFWDNVLAVDLKGPLFACQAAVRQMKARSGGAIVNVASGAAFYAIRGLAAYGAAKAALVSLTRSVALEAGPSIRVNTVLPGPTRTGGTGSNRPGGPVAEMKLPLLGRMLDSEEIADVIVWASSDAAGAVNGALFRVDGGHFIL
jgi:NAD(P)-dependent dehydrogenase (short-subunit alcohol dehydrogenase family)